MRISDWSSDVCSSDLLFRVKGSGVAVGRFRGAIDRMLAKVPRNVTGIMKDWGARTGAYFMFITLFLNNFYPLPPGRTACRRWCGWASDPAARSRIATRSIAATSASAASGARRSSRSEEHTSELQSLMRISYAVFCLKKQKQISHTQKSKHNNKI